MFQSKVRRGGGAMERQRRWSHWMKPFDESMGATQPHLCKCQAGLAVRARAALVWVLVLVQGAYGPAC